LKASEIRHSAVHRKDAPPPKMKMFLQNALLILLGLLDDSRGDKLRAIQAALDSNDLGLLEMVLAKPLQYCIVDHQINARDSKQVVVDRPAKRPRVQSVSHQSYISDSNPSNQHFQDQKLVIDLTRDSDEEML
jgi:hypothetical protein